MELMEILTGKIIVPFNKMMLVMKSASNVIQGGKDERYYNNKVSKIDSRFNVKSNILFLIYFQL